MKAGAGGDRPERPAVLGESSIGKALATRNLMQDLREAGRSPAGRARSRRATARGSSRALDQAIVAIRRLGK